MRLMFFLLIVFCTTTFAEAQELYMKTFGDNKDEALIFLHGGPGYNSAGFEYTTAQKLAEKNFFVIVYDRRGEGRSQDSNANYTFKESFEDLNAIYTKYKNCP